jgi:hypothetical protein
MKTKIRRMFRAAGLALVLSGGAFAATLNGNLTFAGGAILNTDSVNTATGVASWIDPMVASSDGDFAPYIESGDEVDLVAPWTFNSVGVVLDFWSVGGFSFDLTSSSITYQSNGALIVKGMGWTSGNGFDATRGSWNFTSQNPAASGIFSFSAGSAHTTAVPDGGATAALMGTIVLALGVIARRLPSGSAG